MELKTGELCMGKQAIILMYVQILYASSIYFSFCFMRTEAQKQVDTDIYVDRHLFI